MRILEVVFIDKGFYFVVTGLRTRIKMIFEKGYSKIQIKIVFVKIKR